MSSSFQTGSQSFIVQPCKILISPYDGCSALLVFNFWYVLWRIPPFFFCYGFGSRPVVFSYGGKSSGKQNNSTCPGPQYKLQKKNDNTLLYGFIKFLVMCTSPQRVLRTGLYFWRGLYTCSQVILVDLLVPMLKLLGGTGGLSYLGNF